jgi:carboxylesterase
MRDASRHPRLRRALLVVATLIGVVVAVVLVLALIPTSADDLTSTPRPAPDYAAAVQRYDEATAAEEQLGVLEQCRSQLLTHGRQTEISIVLFHGWTNCPRQFSELGQQLHAQGANVLILRAPRHGLADASGTRIGNVKNLAKLSPQELRDYADAAVDIGDGLGRQPRVLGLSMGGVLSAWVAQNRPDVDRAVVVSPSFAVQALPRFANPLFRNLFSRIPDISDGGRDTFKLDHAYAGESLHSLASVLVLAQQVQDQAAATAPAVQSIIVDTNAADPQVRNEVTADVVADWRTHGATVETYEFPASDGLLHDLIDVQQQVAKPDLVYPILLKQLGFG